MTMLPGLGAPMASQFVFPERPITLPNRNDPCWCGSKVKFKHCHRDRHAAQAVRPHEIEAMARAAFSTGECQHPAAGAACSQRSIRSHSVQKRGGLLAIAEDGHVLSPKRSYQQLDRDGGEPGLRREGLNQASTFPGFCRDHDAALFGPIEQRTIKLDRSIALRIGLRALALELQRKMAAVELFGKLRSRIDAGFTLDDQFEAQQTVTAAIHGNQLGINDLTNERGRWDSAFLNDDLSQIRYVALWFDRVIPIAVASAFLPTGDFQGNALQTLEGWKVEGITFTITSYEERSAAIFAWHGSPGAVGGRFVRSLLQLPKTDIAAALISAAFAIAENLFVKPSWWEALPAGHQAFLLERLKDGLPAGDGNGRPAQLGAAPAGLYEAEWIETEVSDEELIG